MSREAHVQFWESAEVQSFRATRHCMVMLQDSRMKIS